VHVVSAAAPVEIEVWWDVVCPWSYLGVRRVAAALAGSVRPGAVRVTWRSFELDRALPTTPGPTAIEEARRHGLVPDEVARALDGLEELAATEGLELDLRRSRPVRSFDAHRLAHHATTCGRGAAMRERLLRAHHLEHRDVGDHDVLVALAWDVGLEPDVARTVLAGDAHADAVRDDQRRAEEHGIEIVPAMVIDGVRATPGALPPPLLVAELRRAVRRRDAA
jgi:predicted DsbA family dithiol-disulfide isomerase